jgi:hypothetical protein
MHFFMGVMLIFVAKIQKKCEFQRKKVKLRGRLTFVCERIFGGSAPTTIGWKIALPSGHAVGAL